MSQTPAIACGMLRLLYDAIRRSRAANHGDCPREIVVHPGVHDMLVLELFGGAKPNEAASIIDYCKGELKLYGVPVRVDKRATEARIISARNVVEYL